jgi:SAM-dependent methyltransferase
MTGRVSDDLSTPLIQREWPLTTGNSKTHVLTRRLEKTRRHLPQFQRKIRMLVSLIVPAVGEQARILEVACGTGFTMLELANLGFRSTGLDMDPSLCALTNVAAAHFNVSAIAIPGDACALPFADHSYDAAFSESFFEHVYNVELALREQTRVLRKGGVLIVLDGNLLNPRTLCDLLFLYPIRTWGRHGGLKWLLTKHHVKRNLYGYLPRGRDEDVRTIWWWRRALRHHGDLCIVEIGTSARDLHPKWPRLLRAFLGSCKIVAVRT